MDQRGFGTVQALFGVVLLIFAAYVTTSYVSRAQRTEIRAVTHVTDTQVSNVSAEIQAALTYDTATAANAAALRSAPATTVGATRVTPSGGTAIVSDAATAGAIQLVPRSTGSNTFTLTP
jgi:hypothetical protein